MCWLTQHCGHHNVHCAQQAQPPLGQQLSICQQLTAPSPHLHSRLQRRQLLLSSFQLSGRLAQLVLAGSQAGLCGGGRGLQQVAQPVTLHALLLSWPCQPWQVSSREGRRIAMLCMVAAAAAPTLASSMAAAVGAASSLACSSLSDAAPLAAAASACQGSDGARAQQAERLQGAVSCPTWAGKAAGS